MATRAKPLDEVLSIADARRSRSKPRPNLSGKGRPPPRECPPDFDVVFVQIGRLDCEVFYRAARVTIDRWLEERGKEQLIRQRAAFVEHQRARARDFAKCVAAAIPVAQSKRDRRKISLCLARAAAQHLRCVRNGGFVISRRLEGDWRIGTRICSAGELLDLAISRGFDRSSAEAECSLEDGADG